MGNFETLSQLIFQLEAEEARLLKDVGHIQKKLAIAKDALNLLCESSQQKSALKPFANLDIRSSLDKLFSTNSNAPLRVAEIYKLLTEGGFTSRSSNPRRNLSITLFRLSREGFLRAEKLNKENSYCLKGGDDHEKKPSPT